MAIQLHPQVIMIQLGNYVRLKIMVFAQDLEEYFTVMDYSGLIEIYMMEKVYLVQMKDFNVIQHQELKKSAIKKHMNL